MNKDYGRLAGKVVTVKEKNGRIITGRLKHIVNEGSDYEDRFIIVGDTGSYMDDIEEIHERKPSDGIQKT